MTVRKSHAYFTPEDYLEIERIGSIKHEYIQRQIVAMAGATKAYVIITILLLSFLAFWLTINECVRIMSSLKLWL
jgi:uncharacterized membrane protein YdbT with pleckstrin-like domain